MATHDALIKEKLEEIVNLIEDYNSTWASVLKNTLLKFKNETNSIALSLEILEFYRGRVGSFSDLVLQKDGKMPTDENDRLETLRKELFMMCQKTY